MTFRPLPGRWFDHTPAPQAAALHPRRPWLALARRTDTGTGVIERIDLDTGDTTTLAEGAALTIDTVAWVGDHLAAYGSDRRTVVRLYDGDGNGVLAERHPIAQGFPSVVSHARGVDLFLALVEPQFTSWEPFLFRVEGDEITLRAHPLVYGPEGPHLHPDGDRFAWVEHSDRESRVMLHAAGVARALPLPRMEPQSRVSVVGWAGRETLVVCSIVPLTGAPDDGVLVIDGVWALETDTGTQHRLFRRGGALPGATRVRLSPDASTLALLFGDVGGFGWIRLVRVATSRASTVRHMLGRAARVPMLDWLDDETLVTVETGDAETPPTVRVHMPARRRTDLYALDGATPNVYVELVECAGGRLLLKTSEARPRYFVSDPLVVRTA